MPVIARGQTSDCSNPVLDLYTRLGGVLTDVAELSFQIFDAASSPLTPQQVYPVSGRQTVDVGTLCPTGDKLGTGHYVARWTVPDAEAVGSHQITWFFKLTLTSQEQSFTEEFDVQSVAVPTGTGPNEYATVQQLRDEGITTAQLSDQQLLSRIQIASAQIDRWTGRWFYPRAMKLLLDGNGKDTLLVGPPIISISEILQLGQGSVYITNSSETVDLENVRIYNRHLTQQLTDPDDRNSPRVQWLSFNWYNRLPGIMPSGIFWQGVQNIQVTGVFGYTDFDGSPTGKTPDLITQACMMMVVRNMAKLGDIDARLEQALSGRLTSQRTRDQSITWAAPNPKQITPWTGDPTIDGIIASYRRPPALGAV